MWIVLGILGFIAVLIAAILSLPVKVILRNDEKNELIIRYKLLGKTYGENPNPDDPIINALLKSSGVGRLKKATFQKNVKAEGLKKTVSDSGDMLIYLLKEILALLRRATITRLHIKIRCVGDEVDEAAIHYGRCCAVVYSFLDVLRGMMTVRKRGCNIDVGCDLFGTEEVFRYEVVLLVRAGHVLAALWRSVMAELKRMEDQKQETQEK